MAVDDVLLRRYAEGVHAPPTLRLYGWRPAGLSLGRRQTSPIAPSATVVRRPTGGQAVLHDDERTYAVAGSLRRPPFPGGVLDTYARIAAALVAGLRRFGLDTVATTPSPRRSSAMPISCFDVLGAHEIAWRGRKLVGSAQVRARGGFLQHGSIPRSLDAERLRGALGAPIDAERFTDLSRAMGRVPSFEEIDAALLAGFSETFGCTFEEDALTAAEREAVERYCAASVTPSATGASSGTTTMGSSACPSAARS